MAPEDFGSYVMNRPRAIKTHTKGGEMECLWLRSSSMAEYHGHEVPLSVLVPVEGYFFSSYRINVQYVLSNAVLIKFTAVPLQYNILVNSLTY